MIHKQLCRHEAWISKNIRCQYLFLLTRIFLYGFWLAGGWHGTTYHRQVDYLFDSLLRLTTKKTPNPLITDPWWDSRWTLPAKGQSWGLLNIFLLSVIFLIFQHYQNIRYLWNITFIYERRHMSKMNVIQDIWTVLLQDGKFAYEEINERGCRTPHPLCCKKCAHALPSPWKQW